MGLRHDEDVQDEDMPPELLSDDDDGSDGTDENGEEEEEEEEDDDESDDDESGGLPPLRARRTQYVGPAPLIMSEDVVCVRGLPHTLGLVAQVHGDESDEDDGEFSVRGVPQHACAVCWMRATTVSSPAETDGDAVVDAGEGYPEELEHLADLEVMDRAFVHGDIVAPAAAPLGQSGVVVSIGLSVDLQLPDGGPLLHGVDTASLEHVRSIRPGHYVVRGAWLGRVEEVTDHVTVQFDDGSRCKVLQATTDRLEALSPAFLYPDDDQCPFYPGQPVRATGPFVYRNARWLRGSYRGGKPEAVVVSVEVGDAVIDWIAASKLRGPGVVPDAPTPPETVPASELHPLTWFSYTWWQLGDRVVVPASLAAAHAPTRGRGEGATAALGSAPPPHVPGRAMVGDGTGVWGGDESPAAVGTASASSASGPGLPRPVAPGGRPPRRGGRRRQETRRGRRGGGREASPGEALPSAALVVATHTTVDVRWQDGTITRGMPSRALVPVAAHQEHDFWPEDFVAEHPESDAVESTTTSTAPPPRIGLVRSVNAGERTASVAWRVGGPAAGEGGVTPPALSAPVTVSVYELAEAVEMTYRLGDVVLRLGGEGGGGDAGDSDSGNGDDGNGDDTVSEDDGGGEPPRGAGRPTTLVGWIRSALGGGGGSRAETSVPAPGALSWVGEIVGLESGLLRVAWADGLTSTVAPESVYVVSSEDDGAPGGGGDSDGSDGSDGYGGSDGVGSHGSWETEDDEGAVRWDQLSEVDGASHRWATEQSHEYEAAWVGKPRPPLPGFGAGGGAEPPGDPLASLSQAGPLATRAPSMEGTHDHEGGMRGMVAAARRAMRDGAESSVGGPVVTGVTTTPAAAPLPSPASPPPPTPPPVTPHPPPSPQRPIAAGELPTPASFGRFDSLPDAPDDHFYGGEPPPTPPPRSLQRAVAREWAMLTTGLPESIWARCYEPRCDLLRAAIAGAPGTPYHDCLFVFDLRFPGSYPHDPPDVHYRSFGLRVNPNLYESGKVCLSLLGTWAGKGIEVWDPSSSTSLQVLVSIQGLVLVPKPYFNEAGYERQAGTAEGEKNARVYNESAFLLALKSSLALLRAPPAGFGPLVRAHFRACGARLLRACAHYAAGVAVGTLGDDGEPRAAGGPSPSVAPSAAEAAAADAVPSSSEGFRIILAKLRPKVESALEALWADAGAARSTPGLDEVD